MSNKRYKGKQGFASMSKERTKTIASLGGKTAHAKGRAYEWNSEQARAAGKKGGAISAERKAKRAMGLYA